MPNLIPEIGMTVYYKTRGTVDGFYASRDCAAIITDVQKNGEDYACRLHVLYPDGSSFTDWLSKGQDAGQWDFTPTQKAMAIAAQSNVAADVKPESEAEAPAEGASASAE